MCVLTWEHRNCQFTGKCFLFASLFPPIAVHVLSVCLSEQRVALTHCQIYTFTHSALSSTTICFLNAISCFFVGRAVSRCVRYHSCAVSHTHTKVVHATTLAILCPAGFSSRRRLPHKCNMTHIMKSILGNVQ